MRKHYLALVLVLVNLYTINAQTRGTKIGYIDMEYILQNVPNYTEANAQLEIKAQKWKQEIEIKKNNVNKAKEALNAEKPLLTKGLIEERETEIKFLEKELLDLQQLRFGPNGNLTTQKTDLIKPIQDQVFTAIQDIAEQQKYDFIFDKTSDFTMIFAAKRYDISDLVLRILNRSDKREKLSKKQLEAELEREKKQDAVDVNPNLVERQNALEARKAERDKIIEDRRLAAEQKKKEAEDKRAKLIADREAKANGTTSSSTAESNTENAKEDAKAKADEARQKQIEANEKVLADRKKLVEDRKRELEAKRAKVLAEREARKNGTVSASPKAEEVKTEISKTVTTTTKAVEEVETISPEDARAKALEARAKIIEERKKELEARREKALQVRDSIKSARELQLKQ
ncbi:OmpH family outer membrane protein [Flavobacterium sp. 7A]|uniref:OmpH family outer membrane protein n=1 Tax=Flavobacterium sp. 7A TaxID=2940571 RepID=UPI0029CABAB0|nr:OmpH family outer membrane protein [Flavobacterium sp. 7A]MCW2117839.1 Skp family chaperone for outer membrane proteins [Flavobacterium sp. 7A]